MPPGISHSVQAFSELLLDLGGKDLTAISWREGILRMLFQWWVSAHLDGSF